MAITIGSNISATKAIRTLNQSSNELASVSERLASGQRINRASDDAAGLAIAFSLGSKARIYSVATRNINDGISLTNIADAAAASLSDIIIRMRELAAQSANGTYSDNQRSPLDREFQALNSEYQRIVETTSFNKLDLLNGEITDLSIEAGFGAAADIRISMPNFSANSVSNINIGTGTFTVSQTLTAGVSTNRPYGVAAGDMNNDGHVDIIGLESVADDVHVFLGNGNGTFSSSIVEDLATNVQYYIDVADFNEDGRLDVAAAAQSGVVILSGDGTGNLSVLTTLGNHIVTQVESSDFDNDGNQDVLFVENSTDKLWVYKGNGNGTFQTGVSYTAFGVDPGETLELGDLNGDSRLDVVVNSASSGAEIGVFLQQGGGTFASMVTYSLPTLGRGSTLADVNGDSKLDLVTALSGNDAIGILTGVGNGTFNPVTTIAAGDDVWDPVAADLNGDGKVDLVSMAELEFKISVHLGNGDGTFQARTTYAVDGSTGGDIALADFNEDGVTDFVNGASNQRIHVFLNGAVSGSQSTASSSLNLSITTRSNALNAITSLETVQGEISQRRGTFGAFMQRLETGKNNLFTLRENVTAAASRIQDADVAQEAAASVRLNILQRMGTEILTQADLMPELALRLLQG